MTEFGRNVPTTAKHVLARHGLELRDTRQMSDRELLALVGLGRTSLAWIRENQRGERCPTCGRPIR